MGKPAIAKPMEIYRGDTWKSSVFYRFNELIGDVFGVGNKPSAADVVDAIANGSLTRKSNAGYEIKAEVKIGGVDGVSWFMLSDHIKRNQNDDAFWFELSAQESSDLEALAVGETIPITGEYDIQFCLNGVVSTKIRGQLTLVGDITETKPCS